MKSRRESLALKKKEVSVTSGKKKASVCKKTVAVSATRPKSREMTRTHCRHTFRASLFTR